MSDYAFGGTHVLCDVTGIDAAVVADSRLVVEAITAGIATSGATLCNLQVKDFEPSGVTALWLLSESHVSVHTYPEDGALFLDAFTCGERCRPERIVDALVAALGPCEHRTSVLRRGIGRVASPVEPVLPRADLARGAAGGRLITHS